MNPFPDQKALVGEKNREKNEGKALGVIIFGWCHRVSWLALTSALIPLKYVPEIVYNETQQHVCTPTPSERQTRLNY